MGEKKAIIRILESWANKEGNMHSMDEILSWIDELNKTTYVNIRECSVNESTFWFYDDYNGEILNRKRSFFSVKGMRLFEDDRFVTEQPVIIQPEIGYLGILCKEIDGVMNFLMQAKIEPGNVNCVQISPTIQATKSNFTRAHGGRLPAYFDYFEHAERHHVIFDQIQSEQGARFYKKRNRNMILEVTEDIEVLPNFMWMTLGQIKELFRIDNLVNMDTRTVLSGIPLGTVKFDARELQEIAELFTDKAFYRSIFEAEEAENLAKIYQYINNYKMFHDVKAVTVPLNQLADWKVDEYGVTGLKQTNFEVRYYDIAISGREVSQWNQPLFKATGESVFGLMCRRVQTRDGEEILQYLVSAKSEIGSFDKIELGPSVQREPVELDSVKNVVDQVFDKYLSEQKGIQLDVMLSEEGGRFYHEQNRNVIMEIAAAEIETLPEGYFWVNYSTLNYLVQVNNCLNIQLRNLLSLQRL